MMQIAIYARHSMDRQEHSTRDQIDRCRAWCEGRGYKIAHVFQDEGVSGSSMVNRPGIRALIETSLLGDFERVIAEDLSRFSRDQGDIASFFKKLKFLDIAMETISDGVVSELHIGLKGTMNALYIVDLADKTRRGVIASVLKGSIPGGRTYGYDMVHQLNERGELVKGLRKINTTEAEVVRKIFARYDEGETLTRICETLNRTGISAPKNGKWSPSTLVGTRSRKTGLLRQTLYKGVVTFNKMAYKKHPDTGRRISVVNSEDQWIEVPAPELTILDEALFDKVQAKIDERSSLKNQRILLNKAIDPETKAARERELAREARARQIRERKQSTYIVSGKLWCQGHNTPITTIRHKVYNCPDRGCPNRNLKYHPLKKLVVQNLRCFSARDLKNYIDSKSEARQALQKERQALETELGETTEKINNIFEALSDRHTTKEATAFLDKLEGTVRRLRHGIAKIDREIALISPLTKEESTGIVQHVSELVDYLEADDEYEPSIPDLFPYITRFLITDGHLVETEYDFERLIRKFRPSKGHDVSV